MSHHPFTVRSAVDRPDLAAEVCSATLLQPTLNWLKEEEYQINNIIPHQGMAAVGADGEQMFTVIATLSPTAKMTDEEKAELKKKFEAAQAQATGQTASGLAVPRVVSSG